MEVTDDEAAKGALSLLEIFMYSGISAFLVLFAGFVSGLSLGLMSQDSMDLMVLMRSGTEKEKKYAKMIMPVVQNTHFTLVTLLLCNAIALEALPIFLRKLIDDVTAIVLSVTVVLLFGEIIPQALCVRFGLVIGANSSWLVRGLRWITSPISYPVSKLLDWVMGKHRTVLFKRQQLKALVSIHHANEGYGGGLSEDEVNVITGALDMSTKTVQKAMTPLDKVFMLPSDGRLDAKTLEKIVDSGHSRVPIHHPGRREDIVGCLLTKDLVLVNPSDALPTTTRTLREMPFLSADAPMFDALNLFQTGRSHVAVVVSPQAARGQGGGVLLGNTSPGGLMPIGIVTLEDVIEELLQEEIVDETDKFVDNLHTVKVDLPKLLASLPPHLRKSLIFSKSGLKTLQFDAQINKPAPEVEVEVSGDPTAPLLKDPQRSAD